MWESLDAEVRSTLSKNYLVRGGQGVVGIEGNYEIPHISHYNLSMPPRLQSLLHSFKGMVIKLHVGGDDARCFAAVSKYLDPGLRSLVAELRSARTWNLEGAQAWTKRFWKRLELVKAPGLGKTSTCYPVALPRLTRHRVGA